ncbi:MAG: redoxin family protein [Oscillospiraceae bacterium]|nr:redoxin family protein [Oscillospiraceae bacterium]
MRKKLSMVLAAVMLVSALTGCGAKKTEPSAVDEPTPAAGETSSAPAVSEPEPAQSGDTEEYVFDDAGITVYLPAEFNNTKGMIFDEGSGELSPGSGVYYAMITYLGITEEYYNELVAMDEIPEEELNDVYSKWMDMITVVAVNGGRGFEAAVEASDGEFEAKNASLINNNGDISYYSYYSAEDNDTSALDPEFLEEYNKLLGMVQSALQGSDFYEPVDHYAGLIGTDFTFETTDLDGNPVNSEDIFNQHDLTMVNIWATWCGPCIRELPELAELNRDIADINCAVIGILHDSDTEDTIAEGKRLMAENGVDYLVVKCPENLEELIDLAAFPTSVFVDRRGVVAGSPYIGAPGGNVVQTYRAYIERLLFGDTASAANPSAADNAYQVCVVDTEGSPVEGVTVQFCSDSQCITGKTGADGIAVFDQPEGSYTVHILKAPTGFAADDTEYQAPETYGRVTITLKRG